VVIFDDNKRFARQTEVHLKLRRELEMRGARVAIVIPRKMFHFCLDKMTIIL
jgi:hypothetical protein